MFTRIFDEAQAEGMDASFPGVLANYILLLIENLHLSCIIQACDGLNKVFTPFEDFATSGCCYLEG